MEDKVHGTFVSEKINKVRWKPEEMNESEYFITGSWDNDTNQLVIWMYPPSEDGSDLYPFKVGALAHSGDVTEIKFINKSTFVVSSSTGSAKLLQMKFEDANLARFTELISWDNLHYFTYGGCSPCTGLACFEDDLVTIGEDGRIVLLTARQKKPLRVIGYVKPVIVLVHIAAIEYIGQALKCGLVHGVVFSSIFCRSLSLDEADSCSLRCVCFLKHNEVLTGNFRGQMKVWDLKNESGKPASTFMLSGEQVGASCVTHHPTQRHLVLAGGEDGSLTVWDLRHHTFPVTLLSAHSESVSELLFHPDRPEHLFSCSTNGELWHWNTSSMVRGSRFSTSSDLSLDENPWLSSDAAKHHLEVLSLLPQLHKPINSLDVNRTRAVCGCDNEAVYVVKNLVL